MEELRDTLIGRRYYRLIDAWLMPFAQWTGLTPNQATLLGLAAAMLVPAGCFYHPLAGAGLILVSGLADSIDGLLARSRGRLSSYGAFFDSCIDRVSDSFYLMGIWILFWPDHQPMAAGLLIAAGLAATFLISYTKARAENLGVQLAGGLMERAARIVYLLIWILLTALASSSMEGLLLWAGALIYLALTSYTAGRRMILTKKMLTES
ncbi:MAG: CDP-alcohol phosphatidyltransferase family protein [Desulfobulbaceae bacterium]|nr:CDP-alcohol phosphatidyltransferase family protein [Desulfobulbaceae bacterium]